MRYNLKSTPTYYGKTLFKSRLEALWANWFDSKNIYWKYEPEKRVCKNGIVYTPDFLINIGDQSALIEIKPSLDFFDKHLKKRISSFLFEKIEDRDFQKFILIAGTPSTDADFILLFDGNAAFCCQQSKSLFNILYPNILNMKFSDLEFADVSGNTINKLECILEIGGDKFEGIITDFHFKKGELTFEYYINTSKYK